ncbi:hypothetical protein QOT17_022278 [Balamuthia mandrillaris]
MNALLVGSHGVFAATLTLCNLALKDRPVCALEEDINSFYKVPDVGGLKLKAIKLFGEVLGVFLLCFLESMIQFQDALLCRVEFLFYGH